MKENNLTRIGFSAWFRGQDAADTIDEQSIARVVAVHKDRYTLFNGNVEVSAEVLGKLMYSAESPLDLPVTGDWVSAEFYDDNTFAIIQKVLPRKTLLKRKTSGKKVEIQLIAANVDTAFVVQSLNENLNLNRLDRYLVMINESGIEPVILLSKCDLLSAAQLSEQVDSIQQRLPAVQVLAFSNTTQDGLEVLKNSLVPARTYCLLGSSGVGKTTLLNQLIGESRFDTQTVSRKESKGRHTTTARQLIVIESGAMMIDTPGMRELGNIDVDAGLDDTFAEITESAKYCRFSDCTHRNEKGCEVLAAVERGDIPRSRYENYLKMHKEAEFIEMSYSERRQKDKKLGKFYRSVQQEKKNRR